MSKKNGAKKKSILAKIAVSVAVIIVLIIGITAIANTIVMHLNLNKAHSFPQADCKQIKAENISDGVWNIYSDNGLKVLQLTDIHLGGGWMSFSKDAMSMNAVAAMITAEKPDFVIATGDIAYPVPFQAGTFNNKSGAKLFAELMETLGVYWTATYGNHDTEAYSYFGRDDITEFYAQYPHCLLRKGAEGIDGFANQVFNIVKSNGVITRSLFTIDSHSYIDGDYFGIFWKYDNVHENQIEWYKNTVKANQNHNYMKLYSSSDSEFLKKNPSAGNPKSSVFLHIPLSEYRDAWYEYIDNGHADTENVEYKYGTVGESDPYVYPGLYEDNFFETMLELHSTDSVFCGHDHLNNFSLNYKGIRLTYSMGIDYLAYLGIYKLGSQRGCTVIEIDENGNQSQSAQNYYQDKYVSHYEKEPVTMQTLGEEK